ncbi:ribosomal large subunit pseudouridine synthase D [Aquitalea magnusonii]|uniref:Ribosomal large subunit pseudouridine synthase D n=1 Tax=Aquitalea magnusonii TaxID=332411 RepID=A0A3G9G7L1_9NEIS|nr:TIGR01621 family pseudouridine synthase [Aquitalea magnusonii]BBF84040.1 ribosomal large subunit pseudouridine synthase D [Aquitalea magnusonii]
MFTLLYSDPRFYLINKHPGVSFHREGEEEGLLDAVRAGLQDDAVWPVHRLDRLTSGLILLARSSQVASQFGSAFAEHAVEKYYLALSDRKPQKKQGLIKGDMEKGRGGAWRLLPTMHNPAITQFFSFSVQPGLRLFLLRPHSGKTHQLRVALKSQSAPILGDTLYGGSAADRGYLHAYALRFRLDGEAFSFVCPPDQGEHFLSPALRDCLQHEAAQPWALPWPRV